ncbi:MAG: YihY/virulence factor BrkB family protein, partial [Deltaproteobacteria bacterium]|nr:YihY/virulence factor BrkB family protein [Deltaproteobacteria bacterium]
SFDALMALVWRSGSALVDRGRRVRGLGLAIDLVDGTVGDFFRHDGTTYAGAVAFYAAISLFPMLLLFVGVGGFIVAGTEGGGEVTGELFDDVLRFLRAAVPYLGSDLDRDLRSLMALRTHFSLAGAGVLLLSSSLVFRSLEIALARVFAWPDEEGEIRGRPRNPVMSRVLFGAFSTALLSVFLGVRYLLGAVLGLAARVDENIYRWLSRIFLGEGSWLRELAWNAVVVLAFMAVLTFFCRRHARPRLLYNAAGGVLFLALWSAAGWAFDQYVGKFAALPSTYGPWAALILIQLWIYYSAVVFVLASEFVKALEWRFGVRGGGRGAKS